MSNPIHTELLAEIEAYCQRHNLSRSNFGLRLMNDPCFVRDIEAGRELRRATIARLQDGMKKTATDQGAA